MTTRKSKTRTILSLDISLRFHFPRACCTNNLASLSVRLIGVHALISSFYFVLFTVARSAGAEFVKLEIRGNRNGMDCVFGALWFLHFEVKCVNNVLTKAS